MFIARFWDHGYYKKHLNFMWKLDCEEFLPPLMGDIWVIAYLSVQELCLALFMGLAETTANVATLA